MATTLSLTNVGSFGCKEVAATAPNTLRQCDVFKDNRSPHKGCVYIFSAEHAH